MKKFSFAILGIIGNLLLAGVLLAAPTLMVDNELDEVTAQGLGSGLGKGLGGTSSALPPLAPLSPLPPLGPVVVTPTLPDPTKTAGLIVTDKFQLMVPAKPVTVPPTPPILPKPLIVFSGR